MVRYLASQLCKSTGYKTAVRQHWITNFLKQNPYIKTKTSIRIEATRINGATLETINIFFDYYETLSWIKLEHIYNVDETGIMEGYGINGLVIGSTALGTNKTYLKSSQSRYWTSIIKYISATGNSLKPVIIF